MRLVRDVTDHDEKTLNEIKKHPAWRASPRQIKKWVERNITDFASARALLAWLTVLVVLMARDKLRDRNQ